LRWGPGWGSGGQTQMDEDLGHHGGLFDGGHERQGAAALRTGGHVDLECIVSEQVGQIRGDC